MIGKSSDDYKPCVIMYPGFKVRKANVLYVRIDNEQSARDKLARDIAAWVSYPVYDAMQEEDARWPKLSV